MMLTNGNVKVIPNSSIVYVAFQPSKLYNEPKSGAVELKQTYLNKIGSVLINLENNGSYYNHGVKMFLEPKISKKINKNSSIIKHSSNFGSYKIKFSESPYITEIYPMIKSENVLKKESTEENNSLHYPTFNLVSTGTPNYNYNNYLPLAYQNQGNSKIRQLFQNNKGFWYLEYPQSQNPSRYFHNDHLLIYPCKFVNEIYDQNKNMYHNIYRNLLTKNDNSKIQTRSF